VEQLEEISNHISTVERIAVDAERDFYKMKAVRYMQDKGGNIYDGIITGIMMIGMFVQISDIGVEGMARFVDMDDYFIYQEGEISTRGKRSSQRFTIGDKVRVKVLKVNIERGFLDFAVSALEGPKGKKQKRG
jgi:ribonuclease R